MCLLRYPSVAGEIDPMNLMLNMADRCSVELYRTFLVVFTCIYSAALASFSFPT